MEIRYLPDPESVKMLSGEELRDYFLIEELFDAGMIRLIYVELDRAIVGSAVPMKEPLRLTGNKKTMAANYFCERRELGIINIGGLGRVTVDDNTFVLEHLDGLYVGRGTKNIEFQSDNPENPAEFYLLSYPAHAAYPTTMIKHDQVSKSELGDRQHANERVIEKYIYPKSVKSAQLVMGVTHLKDGSVWNTFPPHTHQRRTEIYFYFGLREDDLIIHLLGESSETRHIVIRDKQAVISPSWSIHSGVGSRSYSFIWGMGGENQDFDDMDWVPTKNLL